MVDRIDYVGRRLYVYSGGMSEDIIKASKQKLEEFGVDENDIGYALDCRKACPRVPFW